MEEQEITLRTTNNWSALPSETEQRMETPTHNWNCDDRQVLAESCR